MNELQVSVKRFFVSKRALPRFARFAVVALLCATWPQSLPGSIDDIAIDTQGNILVAVADFYQVLKIAPDGTVSVFAGTGQPREYRDSGGDGGPAAAAKLHTASSVTVDPRTNEVYIADGFRIRKVDSNGIITTVVGYGEQGDGVAGGEFAIEFALGPLHRIEFDPGSGKLYIVQENGRIWRVENGRIYHHAGSGEKGCGGGGGGPAAEAQFSRPTDLAVGPDGSVYVADEYFFRIHKIDPSGSMITAVVGNGRHWSYPIPDGTPALRTGIRHPHGLAFDFYNQLHFVADDGLIYRLEEDGTLTLFSPLSDLLGEPATGRMVFDPSGNLILATDHSYRIYEVSADGRQVRLLADLEPATSSTQASAVSAKSELPLPRHKIIGGREVAPGRWPFVVRVDTPSKFCTASLVAPTWVLTAAHCLVDHDGSVDHPSGISVFLGYDWDKGACENTREEIGRVIVHPDYYYAGAGFRNDAALVEILRPAMAQPVKILIPQEEVRYAPSGATATVIGWGRQINGSYPRVLRKVDIPLWPPEDCRENSFWTSEVVHERTLCAGTEGKGIWAGDSGGPLVVPLPGGGWGQVGVTSMGGGANVGYPGVFTRVSSIHDWIREQIDEGPRLPADAVVNVASFAPGIAPGSIASLFGTRLAGETALATDRRLPTELAGSRIEIIDSMEAMHETPLFYVSPGQINFLMPSESATGPATLRLTREGQAAESAFMVSAVAPGLFSANGAGSGVGAITALRVTTDGSRSTLDVFRYDSMAGRFVGVPIDLGPEGDQVFLILYGTGIRNATSIDNVIVGGWFVPVLAFAASPEFSGLDQVNIGPLPRSLTGAGEVDVIVTADGTASNAVTVAIK